MSKMRGKDFDTLGNYILEPITSKEKATMQIRLTAENIRALMLSELEKLKPVPNFNVAIPHESSIYKYSNFGIREEEGLLVTDVERESRRDSSRSLRIYVLKPEGLFYYYEILKDRNNENPLPRYQRCDPCDLLDYITESRDVFEALEKEKSKKEQAIRA